MFKTHPWGLLKSSSKLYNIAGITNKIKPRPSLKNKAWVLSYSVLLYLT